MRNTRWIRLLGFEARRVILAGGLCLCGWGCHQHHYYYYGGAPGVAPGSAGCPPGTGATILPSTVTTSGPVCEVPAAGSSRSTMVSDGQKSRVVVSEPSSSSNSYRFGWRPSDPDSPPAITQVDGAYDGSTTRK